MAQSVEASIARLQFHAGAITGMKSAPATIREGAAVFPFSVAYEESGELVQASYKWGYDLAVIAVEFHINRTVIGVNVAKAYSLRDAFMQKLITDVTLNGACETTNRITRQFGAMEYNGTPTVGYKWLVECKIKMEGS